MASLYPLSLFYEAIGKESYYLVGRFKKPYGKEGAIMASFSPEIDETKLVQLPALFVEVAHIKVPYRIQQVTCTVRGPLIQLEIIQSKAAAYALGNLSLFLPTTLQSLWMPASVPAFLVNYQVTDLKIGTLGIVETIYPMRSQYIMGISYQQRELLVPYCEPFVVHIDRAQQKVTVQLPEGYLMAMLE